MRQRGLSSNACVALVLALALLCISHSSNSSSSSSSSSNNPPDDDAATGALLADADTLLVDIPVSIVVDVTVVADDVSGGTDAIIASAAVVNIVVADVDVDPRIGIGVGGAGGDMTPTRRTDVKVAVPNVCSVTRTRNTLSAALALSGDSITNGGDALKLAGAL